MDKVLNHLFIVLVANTLGYRVIKGTIGTPEATRMPIICVYADSTKIEGLTNQGHQKRFCAVTVEVWNDLNSTLGSTGDTVKGQENMIKDIELRDDTSQMPHANSILGIILASIGTIAYDNISDISIDYSIMENTTSRFFRSQIKFVTIEIIPKNC